MSQFLNQVYFNNTVSDYLLFIMVLVVGIIITAIIKKILVKQMSKAAERTKTTTDDVLVQVIEKYSMPVMLLVILHFSTGILNLSSPLNKAVNMVILAGIIILGAIFASAAAVVMFNKYWEKNEKTLGVVSSRWMEKAIKFIVWLIAAFLFMENAGIKVNTLLAGLGIGGVAIAFAAQAILADVFAFFSIIFDKPFEVGDLILTDGFMGTVEHVGIKTTRLRSLEGEQLVFSNAILTSSSLQNYKRMENRRVIFKIGVTYDTTSEQLKEIPGLIKNLIEEVACTTFDRVHFCEFADFSLNFEIVYYVLSSDYYVYMDILQEVNLRIKEEFDKRGIEFAFPTQTLYLQK